MAEQEQQPQESQQQQVSVTPTSSSPATSTGIGTTMVTSPSPTLTRFSNQIERYYAMTRPYLEAVTEKERLCNYVKDCGKYLQKQCELDIHNSATEADYAYDKAEFLRRMNDWTTNCKRKQHADGDCSTAAAAAWEMFTFGSESEGTACPDSDIDMAISLKFEHLRPDKKYVLSTLARVMKENDKDGILTMSPLLNARYPILRVHGAMTNGTIKIDVSVADPYCKQRDERINTVIKRLEEEHAMPVKKLIVLIKQWSKRKGINNSYKGYLNSFGYTMLVIKFVQTHLARSKQQSDGSEELTLGILVFRFFEMYAFDFDPAKHVIAIHDDYTDSYDANDKNPMFAQRVYFKPDEQQEEGEQQDVIKIHDPCREEENVAHNVGRRQMNHIHQCLMNASELIRISLLCRSTCSLFDLLMTEQQCAATATAAANAAVAVQTSYPIAQWSDELLLQQQAQPQQYQLQQIEQRHYYHQQQQQQSMEQQSADDNASDDTVGLQTDANLVVGHGLWLPAHGLTIPDYFKYTQSPFRVGVMSGGSTTMMREVVTRPYATY